jgi:hypothetical protein
MENFSVGEWEALAEVQFLLEGRSSYDAIACFCTRSMTKDLDLLYQGTKGIFSHFY